MRLKLVPREQVESARASGPVNALGFAARPPARPRGRSLSRKQRRRLARTLRPARQVSRRVRQLQEQHESELRRKRKRRGRRPAESSEDVEIPSAPVRPAAAAPAAAPAAPPEVPPEGPPRPKRRIWPVQPKPRPAPRPAPGLALRRWRRARGRKALLQQMQVMQSEMKRERRRLVSVLQKPSGYPSLATDLQKQGRELKPRFHALAQLLASDRKSQQQKLLEVKMEKEQLAREHLELQLAFAGALEVLRPSALRETDPTSFRCDVKDLRESDFDRFFEDFEGDAQDQGALNAAELSESDAKGLAGDSKDLPLDDDVIVEVEPEHSLPVR